MKAKQSAVIMGININDKLFPFTEWILSGEKILETRATNSLKPYIGRRVGIIRTGRGRAMLVGYVTVAYELEFKSNEEFRAYSKMHRVPSGSKYDKDHGFMYVLYNPVAIEPVPVFSRGIVARRLPD